MGISILPNLRDPAFQKWALETFDGKPWEEMAIETPKSYGAFQVYANLPMKDRSLIGSLRLFYGNPKMKIVPANCWQWYEKHFWRERAALWDAHRAETVHEAELKKLVELGEQRANAYLTMVRAAITIISKSELTTLTPAEARAMLPMAGSYIDTGAKGNRQEIGQPGTTNETTIVVSTPEQRLKAQADKGQLPLEVLQRIVQEAGFSTDLTNNA